MATPAEFLLARIAEDEAIAAEMQANWAEGLSGVVEGLLDSEWRHLQHFDADRMLAECEAKRRIVQMENPGHRCDDANEAWDDLHDAGLRLLAQPYADHPDYREEWR